MPLVSSSWPIWQFHKSIRSLDQTCTRTFLFLEGYDLLGIHLNPCQTEMITVKSTPSGSIIPHAYSDGSFTATTSSTLAIKLFDDTCQAIARIPFLVNFTLISRLESMSGFHWFPIQQPREAECLDWDLEVTSFMWRPKRRCIYTRGMQCVTHQDGVSSFGCKPLPFA